MLKTETDTQEIRQEIEEYGDGSDDVGGHAAPDCVQGPVFEHGHWWWQCTCGALWSVNDAETQTGEFYFDFELISAGEES